MQPLIIKPKGILNPNAAEKRFQITRYSPSPDLSSFVERYWIICWNLSEPYTQETLPYPCVNLVFEKERSGVFGVDTGKFVRRLEGQGRVFGAKFKPGAFYPFVKFPISKITDTCISLKEGFGVESRPLEEAILGLDDHQTMMRLAENFLRDYLPESDENVTLVNAIIDLIIANREIVKVDDVVDQLKLNKRRLQRLFSQYVGVSPKWVIKRYRLHEAAQQMVDEPEVDFAKMASDLGYFDQAHFIKDFKAVVGKTPAEYVKDIQCTA